MPATPTSYKRSVVLPMVSAVIAASSATGMSDVPALTTNTTPFVRGRCPDRRTMARAWT